MKVNNKKIMWNWFYILLLMMAGLFLIGLMLIVSGNIMTTKSSESFYEFNLKEKKNS